MAQEEEDWRSYDPDEKEEEVWIGSSCCQHKSKSPNWRSSFSMCL